MSLLEIALIVCPGRYEDLEPLEYRIDQDLQRFSLVMIIFAVCILFF